MHQLARRGGLHVFRVFQRKLDASAPWRYPAGCEFSVLSEAETLRECRNPELELSEASVRDAYGRGGVCIGARVAGELVGYVWFAFDTAPHLQGVWVKVPPQAIYRYKAYVHPLHRGKGIAPALYRFADGALQGRGREHVVNCIATHNFASISASLRSGAQTLGYLAYWQRGERFVSFHSAAVRRFGLRFRHGRPGPGRI
jgi:ribosomal protein S18 acetylase RimI-like enzyme